MVCDHADHAAAGLSDFPFSEPDKFDVIVLEPFRVFLTQGPPGNLLVVVDEVADPRPPICRVARVGWIAKDNKDWLLFFDAASLTRFFGE